jgi:hypothetical protein
VTPEQEQILAELHELASREQEEEDCFRHSDAYRVYWAARASQEDELQRLALRGKWEGLTPSAMAAAYSKGQPALPPLSYQAMTAVLRQAQRLADTAVNELIREARIEELKHTQGLTQQQAAAQWLDETSA